ncbi:MAG: IS3 family transposase [Melioribacteraceae bacterium]
MKASSQIDERNNIEAKTKRRFRVTTVQNTKSQPSENILKQNFTAKSENSIWTGDITYVWTKEGWIYLAIVMDIYSRKIVSWSTYRSLSTELVIRALMMVFVHRNPERGIIFHSDRGSQYKSSSFREILKTYGIVQSNSSTGNCYDNAVTESFFQTLKKELTYWEKYQTRDDAKRSIFEYIEINYNIKRLHSFLGYLSPVEFEEINTMDLIKNVA